MSGFAQYYIRFLYEFAPYDWEKRQDVQEEMLFREMQISKCQNGPLNVTLEEKALLEFVKTNPKATQEQIAEHIGKSTRTVKRITASLYEKGYLIRENGKRNGNWKILFPNP